MNYQYNNQNEYNNQDNYINSNIYRNNVQQVPNDEHGFIFACVSCGAGFFPILSVAGIVLGIMGLIKSKENIHNKAPKIVSIIGIALNSFNLLVLLIVFIAIIVMVVAD